MSLPATGQGVIADNQLAQAVVLLFFLLLDEGVKPFWLVVGFPVLYICMWTSFVQ